MFNNLPLRTKLIAIVVPPLVVLALIAAYGVMLGFRGASDLPGLTNDVRTLSGVATIGLLVSGLGVVAISRTITDPLEDIRASATDLAENRLPLLVEALRTPNGTTPTFEPIAVGTNDELGDLVHALNAVQSAVAEVASEQQQVVRKGLNDLVINLARRNQSLLDRQIESIDQLESREQDPDTLEALFGLDHLATRMRRNAESLIVLAGAEAPRRRGGPVATADILRVAMSEIEDYRRVQLTSIDPGEIGSQGAVDLAHVCSELMENATQFSPPDQPVTVNGMTQPDGCYLISITDHGMGMNAEQLESANSVLANPPDLGLGLSRSLGFIVIGRLAKRLDVRVELMPTESGGVTALVLVPAVLMGHQAPAAPDTAAVAGESLPAATAASWADPADGDEPAWTPPVAPERGASPLTDRGVADLPTAPVADVPAAPAYDAPVGFDAPAPFDTPASCDAPVSYDEPVSYDAPVSYDEPAFTAEAPPAPVAPAADATPAPVVPGHPEIQSEALAKLMGLIPVDNSGVNSSESNASVSVNGGDAGVWSGPVFEPAAESLSGAGAPPSTLESAMPSGDAFDAGIDSLFDANPAGQTDKGLVRRDRTKSQAPVSEGRPVAASVRSPEEIRQMLARYRDGRARPAGDGDANPTPFDSSSTYDDQPFPSHGDHQ
ncbi:MAG: HAMP domain-containing protein [Acidimicrobiales bacterium]